MPPKPVPGFARTASRLTEDASSRRWVLLPLSPDAARTASVLNGVSSRRRVPPKPAPGFDFTESLTGFATSSRRRVPPRPAPGIARVLSSREAVAALGGAFGAVTGVSRLLVLLELVPGVALTVSALGGCAASHCWRPADAVAVLVPGTTRVVLIVGMTTRWQNMRCLGVWRIE